MLLKEHYHLTVDKIPVGLKGFTHRRDIVFCHAVSYMYIYTHMECTLGDDPLMFGRC